MFASKSFIACAALLPLFLGLSRCAGDSTCLRNSDCERGYECRTGTCQLPPVPADGAASPDGSTSDDAEAGLPPDAGEAGASGGSGGGGGGNGGEAGAAGASGSSGEGGAADVAASPD